MYSRVWAGFQYLLVTYLNWYPGCMGSYWDLGLDGEGRGRGNVSSREVGWDEAIMQVG